MVAQDHPAARPRSWSGRTPSRRPSTASGTSAGAPARIDVDIVAYADVVSDDPVLTLPHPRAHERAFVLAPWHDVDPEAQLPGRGTVAELLAAVARDGVAPRADLELRLPE